MKHLKKIKMVGQNERTQSMGQAANRARIMTSMSHDHSVIGFHFEQNPFKL